MNYLNENPAVFISINKERLGYSGLRPMLQRRAQKANVAHQSPHSFRRYFALEMLRNRVDVFSLQLLMGHADIQVLRRFLKQGNQDLSEVHRKAGRNENWALKKEQILCIVNLPLHKKIHQRGIFTLRYYFCPWNCF